MERLRLIQGDLNRSASVLQGCIRGLLERGENLQRVSEKAEELSRSSLLLSDSSWHISHTADGWSGLLRELLLRHGCFLCECEE